MDPSIENFIKSSFDEDEFDGEDWASIIDVCKKLGVKKVKDLKHVKTDDFVNCGVTVILARKLVDGLNAKQAPVLVNTSPATSSPQPSPSSTSTFELTNLNEKTRIDWEFVGHKQMLESTTRMTVKEIQKMCNIVCELLVKKNSNKNLPAKAWELVSRAMAEKYPIHFTDNVAGNICRSADYCSNKLTTHGEYICRSARITSSRKRGLDLGEDEDDVRRKKQKTKAEMNMVALSGPVTLFLRGKRKNPSKTHRKK